MGELNSLAVWDINKPLLISHVGILKMISSLLMIYFASLPLHHQLLSSVLFHISSYFAPCY